MKEGQLLDGEEVAHEEFLWTEEGDPRRLLAERLVQDVGPEGSIVVYKATFEKGILGDLQEAFPQWEARFESYVHRLWDQGEIFQEGHYVHPSQKESWSLKTVLSGLRPGPQIRRSRRSGGNGSGGSVQPDDFAGDIRFGGARD